SSENSATSKGKYFHKKDLHKLIIETCSDWKTIEQIMQVTGKSKSYLRNVVLIDIADKLERMFEEIPNHPKQKYRTKRNDK
ncbi:MAG: hypothetical protein II644_08495, partial [Paludibacteraceae bacterium]|nr:hypothetical protein [Paludibacteraceae bacterium]